MRREGFVSRKGNRGGPVRLFIAPERSSQAALSLHLLDGSICLWWCIVKPPVVQYETAAPPRGWTAGRRVLTYPRATIARLYSATIWLGSRFHPDCRAARMARQLG